MAMFAFFHCHVFLIAVAEDSMLFNRGSFRCCRISGPSRSVKACGGLLEDAGPCARIISSIAPSSSGDSGISCHFQPALGSVVLMARSGPLPCLVPRYPQERHYEDPGGADSALFSPAHAQHIAPADVLSGHSNTIVL